MSSPPAAAKSCHVVVTGATGLLGRDVLDAVQRRGPSMTGVGWGWSRADGKTILKVLRSVKSIR